MWSTIDKIYEIKELVDEPAPVHKFPWDGDLASELIKDSIKMDDFKNQILCKMLGQ